MPFPEDDYGSIDPAEVAREIFSSSSNEEPSDDSPEAPDPNPAESPRNHADGPAPGTAAFDAMPKAWKKEMEAHWAALTPEVRQYVHSREADVSRGIQMYQQGHSSWTKLFEPYQQIFAAYPNLDPVQLMQGVLNQHIQLSRSAPEQKAQLAVQLLKNYGIDPAALMGNAAPPSPDAVVQELQKRLAALESGWNAAQKAAAEETYAQKVEAVKKFSTDPVNKYWDEVVEDVYLLLKKGAASSLAEAYDLACLRNPAVRQKLILEQNSPPPDEAPKTSTKPKFPNVNGELPSTRRTRKMSLDESIDAIAARVAGLN